MASLHHCHFSGEQRSWPGFTGRRCASLSETGPRMVSVGERSVTMKERTKEVRILS